jgi:hypothetical protein
VPSPATIDNVSLLEQFQAFLSAYTTQGLQPSRKESARHMNSMPRQQFPRHEGNPSIICHGCGQPGHIKARCHNKGVSSKYERVQDRFEGHRDQRYDEYSYGHQNFTPHRSDSYYGKTIGLASHTPGYDMNHDGHDDDDNGYEKIMPNEEKEAAIESGYVSAVDPEDKVKTTRLWEHNFNERGEPGPGLLPCNQVHKEPSLEMEEALDCDLHCDAESHDEEEVEEEVEEAPHIVNDDNKGMSGPEDDEIHDGHEEEEVVATQPATQHEIEEGTHTHWEFHIDTDDYGMVMSYENEYIDYTLPFTPTMREDIEEQEVEEGIEKIRSDNVMNLEATTFDDEKEEIYATRKNALAFALINQVINGVTFSVMQPTPFKDKDFKGAMNVESPHYDFSLKTPDDIMKQDLRQYMNWLCRWRLILTISTCEFPYDKQIYYDEGPT